MAESLARKKRTRAGHKTHVKRLMSEATELLSSCGPAPITAEQRQRLKNYKLSLSKKLETISALDGEILSDTKEEDIKTEISESSEFIDAMSLCLVALDEFVMTAEEIVSPKPTLDASLSSATCGHKTTRVKLPKLETMSFDGKTTEWTPFWDYFESVIHVSEALSDVEKFSYLRSSLKGSAASTINGLSLTGKNYSVAVSLLKERFADPQKIISGHMDALVNLPAVTNAKDLKAVRQLCDDVEAHTRALAALGRTSDQYGELLLPILMNKIPKEIRLDICSKVEQKSWALPQVISQLKEELANRERCEYVAVPTRGGPRDERYGNKMPGTGATLFSNVKQGNPSVCCYCSLPNHGPAQCNIVTSIQKRKEILRRSGRCYVCTRKNHISKNCTSRSRCPKCQGRHHLSVCDQSTKPSVKREDSHRREPISDPPKQEEVEAVELPKESETKSSVSMCVSSENSVLLQTAKASAYRPDIPHRRMTVRLILDGGSQRSYVTHRIKDKLNLQPSHSESLTIKPFGSSGGTPQLCDVVPLCVGVEEGRDVMISAITVPLISSPVQGQFPKQAARNYPHLSSLKLADDCHGDAEVDMLIGADRYWNFVTGGVVRGEIGPTAIHTKIGWVLSGPINDKALQPTVSTNLNTTHVLKCEVTNHTNCQTLNTKLEKFWDLESIGIVPNENSVYDTFEQRITFDGKKYEVNLPWRESHPILHDNYEVCDRRLKSLLTRLTKEPEILREYDSVIKEQLSRGIVEEVSENNTGEVGEVHYLPHHPVVRNDKQTTKVRVVYDASSKQCGGPSLNDCLYTGPSLTENIADILIRFRSHKIALIGDIEKAFHMISVAEDDRDVLRFLWVDDPGKENPEIEVYRFASVVFGLSSSPFLLNATLKHHISNFENEDPDFVHTFLQSLYVDDVVLGANNVDHAYELYIKSKLRMSEGGFNLRKFASNSKDLKCRIDENEKLREQSQVSPDTQTDQTIANSVVEEDESYAKSITGLQGLAKSTEKVLGVQWDKEGDNLVMDLSQFLGEVSVEKPTKRQVVRVTSKFYDPVGFIAPVTVKLKLFCQNLCRKRLDWDEVLDEQSECTWLTLLHELRESKPIHISRCYFEEVQGEIQTVSIHGFCDASDQAYAAVIYLCIKSSKGTYLKLVTSKTRVAPLTRQTIPRLELLAALILARLITHVKKSLSGFLEVSYVRCWSDSEVALYWICGETREWKQFVQNRVLEIRSLVAPELWSYCTSQANPADIPSRGSSPAALMEGMWFGGPEWLKEHDESSVVPFAAGSPSEALKEVKGKDQTQPDSEATSLLTSLCGNQVGTIIDCRKYNCLNKLLRVTALVLKFIDRLKGKLTVPSQLLSEYIVKSEKLWIREIQAQLTTNVKFKNWAREFGVSKDKKGIFRCGGRLDNAELTEMQKHPIMLDSKHHVTRLIVEQSHKRVSHNGIKETLTELRSRFWIVRGRQFVRKVLHGCRLCRRHEGETFQCTRPTCITFIQDNH